MTSNTRQGSVLTCLWVLLAWLACCSCPAAQARIQYRNLLRNWLRQGMARTVVEVYQIAIDLPTRPNCLVTYFNMPAWTTATISVRMETYNQSVATQQCIANSLSWRSVIAGYDDIPPSLQSTVGFRGRLEPYWTAQVLTAPGSGLVPSPPPPPPPPADTLGDYSGPEDYSAPGQDPLAGPLGFGARTSAVIRCMSMYVPAMTLDNETQTEIVQNILAYNLTQIVPSQYVQAFGSQDPKKALIACIRNITASSGPQAPSPPPGPAVPGPGKVQRFIQTIRDFLGLQPFAAAPVTVSKDNPYEGWEGRAQTRDLATDDDGAYQVPSDACQKAFASPAFKGNTMSADVDSPVIVSAKNASYDSCYLTQAHVYINWDPSTCESTVFNTTANLTVTATYQVYPYCNSNWILSMGKVMEFVILVLGVPVALLVLLLGLPTAWRIAYWPFRHAYLRITQKSKWMMVLKHRFRMQAGTDKSWKWWQVVARWPPMTKFLAMRKYFLYACITLEVPDGYSRALQVFIIALCTVSVTIMVWRPSTKLVLGVNPSRIALQLQDFDSDGHTVRALVRYFEIVGISIGLGCLAYLSSLANINKPGNKYWTLHRILSGSCLVYLCAIVALQMINVGAFLVSMHNMEAYTWIVAVQSVNITGALTLQLAVVLQRKAPPPKAAGWGEVSSADGEAQLELQTTNLPPSPTAPDAGDHEQQHSPTTWDNNPTWDRGSGNSQRDTPTRPVSISRHGSIPGPGASSSPALGPRQAAVPMRSWPSQARGSMTQLPRSRLEELHSGKGRTKISSTKSFNKDKGPSALSVLWHKLKLAFSEWILEETQFYTDANTGNIITVRLLRYPSWFLASVLVAFYMLIFHFIKSLIWARDLGECVVTPQACVFPIIQTWATTFSWQQLAIFQTAGNEILENISYLQETDPSGAELLDAILQAETTNGLVYWTNVVNSAVIFFTPGNSKIAQWMDAVGNRMILVSTAGFTLGAALGCVTLTMALASFKVIIKKHRILKILQQLQHSSLKCKGLDGTASVPAPAVASVLAKVQQAALAGAATVHEMAATASTSHLSFLIQDKPRTSDPRSSARPSPTYTHPLPVPSQPAPVAHALETIDSVSTSPADHTIGSLTKPNSAIRRSQFRQHHIIAVVNEAKDDASEDEHNDNMDVKEPERDIVDVTSIAAVRALTAPIGFVVFFIGVLLSATIVQLYVVGVILTAVLAVITTQWFWVNIAAVYYPYLLAIIIIIILNKVILIMWIGESYVSDGDKILRPAGWFAFMIIASITNLILGLFLAIIRLVILLLTTIFTIGMLDRSILSVRSMMDVPYKSFLAGIHLQNSLTNLNDPGLRPGPRGRAIRRWRAAKNAVVSLGVDRWEELVIRNRAMGRDCSDCDGWTKDSDGKIACNEDMPPPVGV